MENIREQFRKAVIMGCHPGMTYEEALGLEPDWVLDENDEAYMQPVISIGRVMAALRVKFESLEAVDGEDLFEEQQRFGGVALSLSWPLYMHKTNTLIKAPDWQLLKPDGSECTMEDQTDETIEALLNLLKK